MQIGHIIHFLLDEGHTDISWELNRVRTCAIALTLGYTIPVSKSTLSHSSRNLDS